jgi:hypothetical protein
MLFWFWFVNMISMFRCTQNHSVGNRGQTFATFEPCNKTTQHTFLIILSQWVTWAHLVLNLQFGRQCHPINIQGRELAPPHQVPTSFIGTFFVTYDMLNSLQIECISFPNSYVKICMNLEFFWIKSYWLKLSSPNFYFKNIFLNILKKNCEKIQNTFAWFFTTCFGIIWENIQRIKIASNINVCILSVEYCTTNTYM